MPVIPLSDQQDPRMALYRGVRDPALLAEHGVCIAEGRQVLRRLLASTRHEILSLLLTNTARRALDDDLAPRLASLDVFVVPDAFVQTLTGHHVHRGALGLIWRPEAVPFESWLAMIAPAVAPVEAARVADAPLRLLAAEGIANPDNIGGLFRNAAAFGVAGVVLDPASSDPLYRKAIRTSMGATLELEWTRAMAWPDAIAACQGAGFAAVGLTTDAGATPLRDVAAALRDAPAVVLVGNEGRGLSAQALALCTHRARIPMAPEWDSLNVATAAGIALYALADVGGQATPRVVGR